MMYRGSCNLLYYFLKIILHNVYGYLQSKIVSFLMNLHIYPRPIYFLRPGESFFNREERIGGLSNLFSYFKVIVGSPQQEKVSRTFVANSLKKN
jgi:hypothetical protein